MRSQDLTEMEWLAATLMSTASRLTRAVALLRAAGDLEHLQAKLATIVATGPPAAAVAAGPPEAGGVASEGERPSGREIRSRSLPVGGVRVGAVFDADTVRRPLSAKITAGGPRPPF